MEVVNLDRERRKRSGKRQPIELFGINSDALTVLKRALSTADPEERSDLLRVLARGSYVDMLVQISEKFEICGLAKAQANG